MQQKRMDDANDVSCALKALSRSFPKNIEPRDKMRDSTEVAGFMNGPHGPRVPAAQMSDRGTNITGFRQRLQMGRPMPHVPADQRPNRCDTAMCKDADGALGSRSALSAWMSEGLLQQSRRWTMMTMQQKPQLHARRCSVTHVQVTQLAHKCCQTHARWPCAKALRMTHCCYHHNVHM